MRIAHDTTAVNEYLASARRVEGTKRSEQVAGGSVKKSFFFCEVTDEIPVKGLSPCFHIREDAHDDD